MSKSEGIDKAVRILSLYKRLSEGETIIKWDEAVEFGVDKRTIQRDLDDIRCFLTERSIPGDIVYDHKRKGYILTQPKENEKLLNSNEILAVCKILLESRSMIKEEMKPILEKLIASSVPPENRDAVSDMINSEICSYCPPHHGKEILPLLWPLGCAVKQRNILKISYRRLKAPYNVERTVKPVGLLFSEYYFYLIAFPDDPGEDENCWDEPSLRFYRVDRIRSFRILDKCFRIPPYVQHFEEGEFRKKVQFMFGGKLRTVRFKYTGLSIEAVLDRLPSAVVSEETDGWLVSVDVFGDGIDMWLKSQGNCVSMV